MRVHMLSALAIFGLGLATFPGMTLAQGTRVDVGAGRVGVNVETGPRAMRSGEGKIVRAKDLTGLSVYNTENENLGKIEDLVIDPASGRIRYAVLSFGGFLGMGDKFFAIPWQKLSFVAKGDTSSGTQKEDYCVLEVSKESLKNAPGFDKANWPNFADRNWSVGVDQYYGIPRMRNGQP